MGTGLPSVTSGIVSPTLAYMHPSGIGHTPAAYTRHYNLIKLSKGHLYTVYTPQPVINPLATMILISTCHGSLVDPSPIMTQISTNNISLNDFLFVMTTLSTGHSKELTKFLFDPL